MQLVIVESPNKARKIQQLLGGGFTVAASVGHIADLPKKEIGVCGPSYEPELELTESGKSAISKLKKFKETAEHVWLATDPDREGEAIAAHLVKFLKLKDYKRITFHEITKDAIMKALKNPRTIDEPLYQAQKARRVIDRLVGYKVSPELSKLAGKALSAGRVQSVALRLIVERERAIREFKVTSHFGVQLLLAKNGSRWMATWDTKSYITADEPYILDRRIAEQVAKITKVSIDKIETKEVNKKPPAPFITTTLQKAANLVLGLDASAAMKVAQKLFEQGFITYHRTDNPNLSEDCLPILKTVLQNLGFSDDIADKQNKYKAKANAQEAHEAIRPTDFLLEEPKDLDEDAKKLYQLIRARALASQMNSAKIAYTTVTSIAQDKVLEKNPIFITKGKQVLYQGWMKLTKHDLANEKEEDDDTDEEIILPDLTEKDIADVKSGKVTELQTKPPARYSEPALISKLEKEGIGRPATYASILTNIKNRKYITLKGKVFIPEASAELIVDTLVNKFDFMEVDYTKGVEENLDHVATGTKQYLQIVTEVDQELDNNLQTLIKKESYPCPSCQALMRRIQGKKGWFWGCSRYTDGCRQTLPDYNGKPGKVAQDIPVSEYKCPLCGKFLRRIKGKTSYFFGCSGFEQGCKYIADDCDGKPLEHFTCPKCGKRLRRLKGEKNYFWSCSGYKEGCKTNFKDDKGKPIYDIEKEG